jgi:integrase
VKRALKPVLNELDSRGGAHAFRHANATLLDSLSASMAVRQERLGHVDARHTHLVTADDCVSNHAKLVCKPSTLGGYESVLRKHLKPWFGSRHLDQIGRGDMKSLIKGLVEKKLTRSSVRNAISIVRSLYNQAIDDGHLEFNPAVNLGRFTRQANSSKLKGVALTPSEVQKLIATAKSVCPMHWQLFLVAVRAGLRRGELVSLRWGDLEFGSDGSDPNRFILVQHNYVRRQHTTTKSKKVRRVDMSRELRSELLKLRAEQLEKSGRSDPADLRNELVFPSTDGGILDPDNLYHRFFRPTLMASGLRKFRLHDLRHSFGSLLLQSGASVVYVKEQMGHSSIQVTVDTYGHLVPGANISFIDRLDESQGEATS